MLSIHKRSKHMEALVMAPKLRWGNGGGGGKWDGVESLLFLLVKKSKKYLCNYLISYIIQFKNTKVICSLIFNLKSKKLPRSKYIHIKKPKINLKALVSSFIPQCLSYPWVFNSSFSLSLHSKMQIFLRPCVVCCSIILPF